MDFKPVEKVYVSFLYGNGFLPTTAKHISHDIFELQDSKEDPYEEDEWVFKPGDLVRCVTANRWTVGKYGMSSYGFKKGEIVIIAYEKVQG